MPTPLGQALQHRLIELTQDCRQQGTEPALLLSCAQGMLSLTPTTWTTSTGLPGQGAGPALRLLQLMGDRDNSPTLVTLGPTLPLSTDDGEGEHLSHTHTTSGQTSGEVSAPTLTPSGSATLCCPGEGQGCLS